MSTSGTTIWAMETSGSYIYSFEQVPFSEDGTEEPPSHQPFITAEVHLYFDGRVDLCWGDICFVKDRRTVRLYPTFWTRLLGSPIQQLGESNTGRFPYSFCQMLLGTCFLGDVTVYVSCGLLR
eukprot:scaffold785_cov95-Cylindrotheca_fusiformis.AAC.3